MASSPDIPEEDPAVKRLRNRQIRELAELDEEENERLKQAFSSSRGFRAFRRATSKGNADGSGAAAGGRAGVPGGGSGRRSGGGGGGTSGARVFARR